jgi:hypothetical protein
VRRWRGQKQVVRQPQFAAAEVDPDAGITLGMPGWLQLLKIDTYAALRLSHALRHKVCARWGYSRGIT